MSGYVKLLTDIQGIQHHLTTKTVTLTASSRNSLCKLETETILDFAAARDEGGSSSSSSSINTKKYVVP